MDWTSMLCLTGYSKLGEELDFKECASVGISECSIDVIIEVTILENIEGVI